MIYGKQRFFGLKSSAALPRLRLDLAALFGHGRSRAGSSLPMMIRASEPPINWRRSLLTNFNAS